MTESRGRSTRRIIDADPPSGFRSGVQALDDYFQRHALPNDRVGIGRTYVMEAVAEDLAAGLPTVVGFYTLSMASVVS